MKNPKYRVAATVAVMLAVVAMFCWYYYTHDPLGGKAPRCLFKLITGYECPGCGSQRAFHSLLHGDIAAAWHCMRAPSTRQSSPPFFWQSSPGGFFVSHYFRGEERGATGEFF